MHALMIEKRYLQLKELTTISDLLVIKNKRPIELNNKPFPEKCS